MGRSVARPGAILISAALAAAAALPAAATVAPGTRDQYQARFLNKPAPDFTLSDLHGGDVRLSGLRGKVVLLNFWYSSCPPCRRETPDLMTLYRLHQHEGLEVLGVNLDDLLIPEAGHGPLSAFLKDFPVPYRVLLAGTKVFDEYGQVPVQPISFLVDRSGQIVRVFWGAVPGAAFEKAIQPYLAPAPGARP
jgi:peroxiredoxin